MEVRREKERGEEIKKPGGETRERRVYTNEGKKKKV